MIHGQGGAKADVTNCGGQQHEQVYQQECRQIPPAEPPGSKPVPGDQRPPKFEPTLRAVKDAQTAEHLAERGDPGDVLTPTVEIDQERYDDELGQRAEQDNRQKQTFGDHWSESHQAVNHQSDEDAEKKQDPADHPKGVDTEKKNQGVINQRNGSIGQEQSQTQAQQGGDQTSRERGFERWPRWQRRREDGGRERRNADGGRGRTASLRIAIELRGFWIHRHGLISKGPQLYSGARTLGTRNTNMAEWKGNARPDAKRARRRAAALSCECSMRSAACFSSYGRDAWYHINCCAFHRDGATAGALNHVAEPSIEPILSIFGGSGICHTRLLRRSPSSIAGANSRPTWMSYRLPSFNRRTSPAQWLPLAAPRRRAASAAPPRRGAARDSQTSARLPT